MSLYDRTVECPECKTNHSVPDALYKAAHATRNDRNPINVYCPYGHSWFFTPQKEIDENERIRLERDRLKQQVAYKDDRIHEEREAREAAERSAKAYRASATRVKNRAKHGVCPCCNRTFKQLAAHMKAKHPKYQPDANVIKLAKKVRAKA